MVDFFYEPAKGIVHSPEEFARGIATGTLSLLQNSVYGIFSTVSQVTGSLEKGLAVLALDSKYLERIQRRPGTSAEQLIQGAQELGVVRASGWVPGYTRQPLVVTSRMLLHLSFPFPFFLSSVTQGIYEGITGLVSKPIEGAGKEGIFGFIKVRWRLSTGGPLFRWKRSWSPPRFLRLYTLPPFPMPT